MGFKTFNNLKSKFIDEKTVVTFDTNKDINDFITCTSIPNALWINKKDYQQIVENFKKDKRYEVWKQWIDKMYKLYYI